MTEHAEEIVTESVWDYPRPPAVVRSAEHVVVHLSGWVIADTRSALRVLETSHPPVYYLPRTDIAPGLLSHAEGTTYCEFKGTAAYFDLVCPNGRVVRRAAWHFPTPTPGFEALVGHVAFYPGRMDRCTVDGEVVRPQEGDFYGGWVTSHITGPFKGGPGTLGW